MLAAMARDAALRNGRPPLENLADERALRATFAPYWIEGAPVPHETLERHVPGEARPIRVRIYRPTAATSAPVLLWIHGGGWVFGSIEETEPAARHLAAETGAVVVSTSYRLAPEHPFPAGLHDCETVLRWIKTHASEFSGDASRVAIGGASAGGNLAAAVALRAPQNTIRAQLLFYGVLGNSFETDSYTRFGPGQFGLSRQRMIDFFDQYVSGSVDRNDAAITPMNGKLAGMPPVWICAAEWDVLRDDSVQFHDRLKQQRSGDVLVMAKGLTHGFVNKARHLPAAKDMIDSAAAFFKQHV